jgi:hypothetical protein
MTKNLLFAILSLAAFSAFGWGQTGHRVIGQIAETHLTDAARENIRKVLGHESLAMAGTFMDEIRSDKTFNYMDPWHYCTVPTGKSYEEAGTPEEGDAIWATQKIMTELRTKNFTTEDEAFNLKLLIHLIGDLHQPLHVGNGQDRGGNDIKLEYFREPSNLHRVWDSGMIDGTRLSYTEYAEWINHPDPADVALWQSTDIVEWAMEGVQYRDAIYTLPKDMKLSYAYDREHAAAMNLRLLQAGVRLAGVLNEIYG